MARSHLRVYYGPDDCHHVALTEIKPAKNKVTVPLAEILATLVDAARQKRAWLRDFEQDELTISTDLYEVILAYPHYRRPSA
jgi:hypothetical protein